MADLAPVPYQTPLVGPSGILTVPWIAWYRQLLLRVGGNNASLLTNPLVNLGDMIYGGNSGTPIQLPGSTSSTKKFMTQTGNGSVSAPPAWGQVGIADVFSATQTANLFFAGPSSGAAALATFRPMVNPDLPLNLVTKTANYTALISDQWILCNTNAFTVTLPAASSYTGQPLVITKIGSDANAITVSRAGSDTIEGDVSTSLNTRYETIQLASDRVATWYILSRRIDQSWSTQYSFTPTTAAFGTISGASYYTRRVGDTLEFVITFTTGTVAGSTSKIAMPTGLVIDSTKMPASFTYLNGLMVNAFTTGALFNQAAVQTAVPFYDGSDTGNLYLAYSTTPATAIAKSNANAWMSSSTYTFVTGSVPISGWKGK